MTRLFLDLDGVMADLEGDYLNRFGHPMDEAESKAKMWSSINGIEDYFYHLPMMAGALEFYRDIKRYDPIILTSCPTSRYAEVATQKMRWVRKNLDPDVLVITVDGSDRKQYFVQHKGDILVDDYGKNCREWASAGGTAIQHRGTNFVLTLKLVTAAFETRARAA